MKKNDPWVPKKSVGLLAQLAAFGNSLFSSNPSKSKGYLKTKPKFSSKELSEIRGLNGLARKRKVSELKLAHYQARHAKTEAK